MTSNSFYGTYLGNAGALAQGNPNPLMDPRNKIPGAFPNSFPMLPGEDPGAIKGVYGTPNQGQPFMNTPPILPLAQGPAGGIGNMAGMEGAQLAGGITPKGGFNLFNLFNLKDNVNKILNTGASPTTPAGQMINGMKRNRDQYEQLRQQGIL